MSSNVNTEARSSRASSSSNMLTTEKMRGRSSSDMINSNNRISTSSSSGFDVQRVYETFVASLREADNPKSPIGTQDYIDGYRELLKFFDQLGLVFKFVKDDVVDKLRILQSFVDNDKKGTTHSDTIQSAIDYETEHNLIKTNSANFARTLLRLHRALLFIIQFLDGLSNRPSSDSTSTIAASSYDATLAHHHGFLIRQSAKLGFRVLPTRRQLDEVIFHGRKTELYDQYKTFIKTIKQIYDTVERYYAEMKYLQLP